MNCRYFVLFILWLCVVPVTWAVDVPNEGLKAEMEGRWQDAIQIYRHIIERDKRQGHLWKRIAQIQSHLGNKEALVAALEQAIKHNPKDAALYSDLSKAYGALGDEKKSLAAINRAVELAPTNTGYLHDRAAVANWNKDIDTAMDSYARILAQDPDENDALLGLARVNVWRRDFDQAASFYRQYTQRNPQDEKALNDYIDVEIARKDYAAASELGKRYRQRFGDSVDYWLRMSEIYALAGEMPFAIKALGQATQLAPRDATLYFRIASAYASADDPQRALEAIDSAVEIEPENSEYLMTRAELASWSLKNDVAIESYQRVLRMAPDDPTARLGLARVYTWDGNVSGAIAQYAEYLSRFPQVHKVWIEYIDAVSTTTDYVECLALLERYREQFGETTFYLKKKAQVLAWAGRPREALTIADSLLPELADDDDLLHLRVLALEASHRPREAQRQLSMLEQRAPEREANKDLRRFVRTPSRSHISLFGSHQEDSDIVTIGRSGVDATYAANPERWLSLHVERQNLETQPNSGFETIDGRTESRYTLAWIGLKSLVTPGWALDVRFGAGSVTYGHDQLYYKLAAEIWPSDSFSLNLSREQDLHTVSPLAASLGVERQNNQLSATWSPDLRYTVDAVLEYDTYSRGNDRWLAALAPRRAVLRSQRFNVDLGVNGRAYGFSEDPSEGYYSPSSYRSYGVSALVNWKLAGGDGVSFIFSGGRYKDSTMEKFESNADVTANAAFGVFRSWMLNLRGAFSENGGGYTGAYRSSTVEATLTAQF